MWGTVHPHKYTKHRGRMGDPWSPVRGMKPLSQRCPGKAISLAVQLWAPADDPAAGEALCIWPPAGLATAHLGEEPKVGKERKGRNKHRKRKGKGDKRGCLCVNRWLQLHLRSLCFGHYTKAAPSAALARSALFCHETQFLTTINTLSFKDRFFFRNHRRI